MLARLGSFSSLATLALLVIAGCGGDTTTNNDSHLLEEPGASGIGAESADSSGTALSEDGIAEASPAHDFTLPGIEGDFTLSDHEGEVVVLNFWATWNEPSVQGMDALNEVHSELGADGISVVGVSEDEGGLETVQDWAENHGIAYTLLADASKSVAQQFGDIEFLPTTIIIDRQGLIREQHTGILTHDELLDLLGPILIEEDEPLSALPQNSAGDGPQSLSPLDVHILVGEGAMLVDIRPHGTVKETGTALDAEHHPFHALIPQDLPANFGVPVIFLGDGGGDQPMRAAERAMDWGYASVYVVEGGLTAWLAAGLPVAPLTPLPSDAQPLVRARTVIG